jgi:hypothetical protein
MTPRRPPALANWLLTRSGLDHQNPPLAGDLLEEFRGGRSRAWFWRQTLVAILNGFVQNARLFKRLLIANMMGWAAQAGVTFALGGFHYPPELHGMAQVIVAILLTAVVFFLPVFRFFPNALKLKAQADDILSSMETAQRWEHEYQEPLKKWLRRTLLLMFACIRFVVYLLVYCFIASFATMPLGFLVLIQTWWLFQTVKDVLKPDPNPGPAKIFTTLK